MTNKPTYTRRFELSQLTKIPSVRTAGSLILRFSVTEVWQNTKDPKDLETWTVPGWLLVRGSQDGHLYANPPLVRGQKIPVQVCNQQLRDRIRDLLVAKKPKLCDEIGPIRYRKSSGLAEPVVGIVTEDEEEEERRSNDQRKTA